LISHYIIIITLLLILITLHYADTLRHYFHWCHIDWWLLIIDIDWHYAIIIIIIDIIHFWYYYYIIDYAIFYWLLTLITPLLIIAIIFRYFHWHYCHDIIIDIIIIIAIDIFITPHLRHYAISPFSPPLRHYCHIIILLSYSLLLLLPYAITLLLTLMASHDTLPLLIHYYLLITPLILRHYYHYADAIIYWYYFRRHLADAAITPLLLTLRHYAISWCCLSLIRYYWYWCHYWYWLDIIDYILIH
jgi:hypothetical protein